MQQTAINQYITLNTLYEENNEFLHSLLLEAISLIVEMNKQKQEEETSREKREERIEKGNDDRSTINNVCSPPLTDKEQSLPSLEYQFENFEKQIQAMQKIIQTQSQELAVITLIT